MKNKKTHKVSDLYTTLQTQLSANLSGLRKIINHPSAKGDVCEEQWKELLRNYLPNRYSIESKVHVVDSCGGISRQIDIAIFDGQYSLFMFRQKGYCCLPAESIYAVFEVKQDISTKHIKYAAEMIHSVRKLHRTNTPIPQISGEKKARNMFEIIGGILSTSSGMKKISITKSLMKYQGQKKVNIGCSLDGLSFNVDENTRIEYCKRNTALMFFCLKLFKRLQQIGTAPAVDVDRYL